MRLEQRALIQSVHGPYGLLRRLDPDRLEQKIYEAADETRAIIESAIIQRAPVESGSLAAGIKVTLDLDGNRRYKIVATAEARNEQGTNYAPFVEEGTGIWGPKHQMVRPFPPNSRRRMRFDWTRPGKFRDYGGFSPGLHFVREHAGAKPQHFMRRGWRAGMRQGRIRFGHLMGK